MADPLGTLSSVIEWIGKAKQFYDYCNNVYEAGDTMRRLLNQTNDVTHQLEWIRDHYHLAVKHESAQKELLALFENPRHYDGVETWDEGPTLRELKRLLEELQDKLKPLDAEEEKRTPKDKKQKFVIWQQKKDAKQPGGWDGKAMMNETKLSDGKIRHKNMRTHLHNLKNKFSRVQESSVVRRFMFPFSEKDIKEDLDTLQGLCNTISHVVGRVDVDINTKSLAINERMEQRANLKDFRKILEWLSPLTFQKAHDDILSPLSGPTINSDWLIEDDAFRDWKDGRPWRIFIFGNPGSGKSILSSQVIEHLRSTHQRDPSTAVLFLLLRYQEQKTQTLQSLMGSLLRQIIDHRGAENVPDDVKDLWQEEHVRTPRPSHKKVLEMLVEEIGKLKRTYIVIDGLDEASDDTSRALKDTTLKFAQKYNSSRVNGKVSLIFTSRHLDQKTRKTQKHCDGMINGKPCPNIDLRIFYKCIYTSEHGREYHLCRKCVASGRYCKHKPHELFKLPHDRLDVLLKSPDDSIRKFVASFLEEELRSSPVAKRTSVATNDSESINGMVSAATDESTPLARMLRADPTLSQIIVSAIVENAGGLYMLAAMQWRKVHECYSRTQVDWALQNLPKELDDSFEDTLNRMVGPKIPDRNKLQAKRVVLWASQSRRLLTLTDLTAALATEEGEEDLDPEAIKALTRGLVVESTDQYVRLVHRTAYQYLSKPEVRERWFPDAEEHMALICLKTLTDERLQSPVRGAEEDRLIRERLNTVPFASYAAQHWGFHAQSCQTDPKIAELTKKLLTEHDYLSSSIQISAYCEQDNPTGWDQRHGVNRLHVAAWFGLESTFEDLIRQGLEINGMELNSKGRTPLIYACRGGRPEAVQKLIALNADANKRDADKLRGFPPLMHAAMTENLATVKILCTYEAVDVNARVQAGRTTLMCTAQTGYKRELEALLAHKDVDVNLQDFTEEGFTALMIASGKDSVQTVDALLSAKGIDIEKGSNASNSTALHFAAMQGQDEIVQLLLKKNADPEARDKWGGTPLRRAIDKGHRAVIQEFKDLGFLSTSGTEDGDGKNLLFSAAVNGYGTVVQELLDAGFDANSLAADGQTPLHDAVGNPRLEASRKLEVAKALIGAGADKGLRDADGKTAADLAYANGDFDVGDLISPSPGGPSGSHDETDLPATSLARRGLLQTLKKKTDNELLKADTEGETPLAIAIYSQQYDCIETILGAYARQGQGIDTSSVYNRTPVHEAARSTQAWIVKKLLAHRPLPALDRVDNLGMTALSEAVNSANVESIIALVEAGAKFDKFHLPTEEMLTAAIEANKVVVVKAMLDAGADVRLSHRNLARDVGNADVIKLVDHHDA